MLDCLEGSTSVRALGAVYISDVHGGGLASRASRGMSHGISTPPAVCTMLGNDVHANCILYSSSFPALP